MPRRKQDPVDAAVAAYQGLTTEQRRTFNSIVRALEVYGAEGLPTAAKAAVVRLRAQRKVGQVREQLLKGPEGAA